ncbi:hypothetical protein, partial [Escherichia coli]|uniref:hypothetical protein n=2 Tax=Enterobacterales TaxID=91347 RepID=UPI001958BF66
ADESILYPMPQLSAVQLIIEIIPPPHCLSEFTITSHCAHPSDGLCAIFPPEPQNRMSYPLKTAQNGADDF